jgi:BirA family biotin operon repressor/biotin-[acetyl-CoA-carboxylase] ligase
MKLKEKVFDILSARQGEAISGEKIANQLGVTRNAIWKSIKTLKDEGYPISSVANTGYVLSHEAEVFSASKIESLSKNNIDVVLIDNAESSNDIAKELAKKGAKEGTVVVVKKQSAGKGRMGRRFISNEENGLYMSIILRPQISAQKSVKITVIGAVSTLEAIEESANVDCSIKWVNDIFIGEKKVCGILTEASINIETGLLDYAILGIGVNITSPKGGFDEEIKSIATSIYALEAPRDYKSKLCALIVDKFLYYYKNIENMAYIGAYRAKSNLMGKKVDVIRGNEIISGEVVDIDDEANLVLNSHGNLLAFNSGEARVKK